MRPQARNGRSPRIPANTARDGLWQNDATSVYQGDHVQPHMREDGGREYWDNWHQRIFDRRVASPPSELATRLGRSLQGKDPCRILDVGCGGGTDAVYLASLGHRVVGIDISAIAISRARAAAAEAPRRDDIEFHTCDIAQPLPFDRNSFDVVYSHLALHYFDSTVTRMVFAGLHRACRAGGILFAAVKSTNDPLYGKGIMIEDDMYCYSGHRQHFFSPSYARHVLESWNVLDVSEYPGYYDPPDTPSCFLRLVAGT